jgi:predicted secreted protein
MQTFYRRRPNKEAEKMHARVVRYRIPEARFGEVVPAFRQAIERLREIEGASGGYLLIDRDNSMALTFTFWENQAAMEASEVAASRLRSEAINAVDGEIQAVHRCEVALDFSEMAQV